MINLFSLLHLGPDEQIERIYRSHPLRLVAYLSVACLFFILPWFFLFDYTGKTWLLAILCWVMALGVGWIGFDVWSSSLVIVTSRRVFGAQRERWGRVRIYEWLRETYGAEPVWEPRRWSVFGVWRWMRGDQPALILTWAPFMPGSHGSSERLMFKELVHLWRLRRRLTNEQIDFVRKIIDDVDRA